ncbi:acyltransferase [Spirulina sp. CS-785/01]|uniref:acyltransferase n=1 Tax=Spirulina sp. CS-785/01 TaxID=3021716 RepID=UPI00232C790E|nr:acyltransferase [Spirulina sp. CS-785/01]MDB9312955.1 acyltransferase [Spirulina sp. CS-785/01]
MTFLTKAELSKIPFKFLGENVRISNNCSIYNPELTEIHDNSRIDDFCVISGKVFIGKYVHIAVFCNVAGGSEGIIFHDFSGLAYGCHVFTQSDDYSGQTLTNPTVPSKYKSEIKKSVTLGKHCIVGTGSLIFPGANLGEGTAIGAASVIRKSTEEWSIYLGNPAKKVKARSRNLLKLEAQLIQENASVQVNEE